MIGINPLKPLENTERLFFSNRVRREPPPFVSRLTGVAPIKPEEIRSEKPGVRGLEKNPS